MASQLTPSMTFHPDTIPNLKDKVYIVTGGNAGMLEGPSFVPSVLISCRGYQTIRHLSSHGARVYMGVRSRAKGMAAIESIKSLNADSDIQLLIMDHMSLATIVSAAREFTSRESRLDGLVSNAGIMATPFAMSSDGNEAQWQTNYLAHWLLTRLLLSTLQATAKISKLGEVRIVNVSATAHKWAKGIDFEDINQLKGSAFSRYAQSKLANILHARTLHQLYGPGSASAVAGKGEIWVAAVQPGFVKTDLHDQANGTWMHMFQGIVTMVVGVLGLSLEADQGSWTQLFAVSSDRVDGPISGKYFKDIAKETAPSKDASDQGLAKRLEEWTEKKMKEEGWVP